MALIRCFPKRRGLFVPSQTSNLRATVALDDSYTHYNFVRVHRTLCCTPVMAAGVTDRLWSLEDMVGIVDEWEANR